MLRFLIPCFLPLLALAEQGPPNVVVILADDQGWGDLSLHGNKDLRTPHIDSLAKEGASFERFFVQPVCAPTRAEFFTGRFFSRTGVRGVSTGNERLNPDEVTVADVLKGAGYATGAFGKWHSGSQPPYHPNDRGFDQFVGFTSGHWGNYFDPIMEENGKLIRGKGYITDDLTSRALKFIEAHQGEPFFCYLPLCTPHSPMQVPDEYFERFGEKALKMSYGGFPRREAHTRAALAMVENIDWNVGRVLKQLDELKIARNTLVVYFSDNGPNGPRWNGGMKGVKGSVDEGGVRVPCLMRWPGRIKAGSKVGAIAGAVDLLPTLASATGADVKIERPMDGIDLMPHLEGQSSEPSDRLLISVQGTGKRMRYSVRSQAYRWVKGAGLFDPKADPMQKQDLTGRLPKVAKRMEAFADEYLEAVASSLESDDRPFTVGFGGITWLPARDGTATGKIRRSGRAPNCSFFTGWSQITDTIEWQVQVKDTTKFEAILHYTCPKADVGSVVSLEFNGATLEKKIEEPHDPPLYGMEHDRSDRGGSESFVKDFKALRMGVVELPAGVGKLRLRAIEKPGESVAEVRWLELRRIGVSR